MKIADLRKAYNSLHLIVHQNKYLIPQKPKAPINTWGQFTQYITSQPKYRQLLKLGQKKNKQQKTTQVKINLTDFMQQKIKNGDPQYLIIKQKYEKQSKQFWEKKKQYNQLYIQPANFFHRYKPYMYFIHKISKQPKQNQSMNIIKISQKWKLLTKQDKQKLQKQCEQQKLKYLPSYVQYVKKHKIPILINHNSFTAFMTQYQSQNSSQFNQTKNKQQHIRTTLAHKYKQLSLHQLQKYQKIAKYKKMELQQQLIKFLKMWNITQKQLNYIKQISKQYNEQVKKTKKNKKMISQLEAVLDQQNQIQSQQHVQKNN